MPKALQRRIRLVVERQHMTWAAQCGRLAFSRLVTGPIQLSFPGEHGEFYYEIWQPIGWGLYWRAARTVVCLDKD